MFDHSRQRHKNIVCIIGLCLDGKLPFLLTEYVIGECLKDFLKANGQLLTWPQRVRMVRFYLGAGMLINVFYECL